MTPAGAPPLGSGSNIPPDELAWMTLTEVSGLIQKRTVSPVEVTEVCLARIARHNPRINAFITVTADSARAEAKRAEQEIVRGNWRGPLHGIPLALKDLVETAGVKTTAASAVLQDYIPEKDAHIVQRLREAGVVLLGKTNLHEFAYGGSGIISHYGAVRNPWDQTRITGGSSSGSAAATAAGLCYGAIGTDTAGSIRLPSSFCGLAGLKPTYGLVSAQGIIPLSWTQDHAGPIARTATDAALILQVIASYDSQDLGSQRFPAVHYPAAMQETKIPALRIGVLNEMFWQELDPEVEHALKEAVAALTAATAGVRTVTIPMTGDRGVVSAEAFTYHQMYMQKSADKYDPETLRRIRAGAEVTAPAYIGQYRNLQRMRRGVLEVFQQVDVLITPTTPVLPPTIAELEAQPDMLRPRELVMLRNTRPFNVVGLPSITVPCGFSKSGLPIGMQISGAPGAEATVLALAHAWEQQTPWHKRRPPVDQA